jgi:hypothetical protein
MPETGIIGLLTYSKCMHKHWPKIEPEFTPPEDPKRFWNKVLASTDLQTRLALQGSNSFPYPWHEKQIQPEESCQLHHSD